MTCLKSNLFRGDKRLAGALTDHAKHVTKGDRGPHVRKIQSAVLLLEGGRIDGREIEDQRYGPTTAKAVLAYKTRRGIINRTYQSAADDIVGIMTMQALDAEMVWIESHDIVVGIRT